MLFINLIVLLYRLRHVLSTRTQAEWGSQAIEGIVHMDERLKTSKCLTSKVIWIVKLSPSKNNITPCITSQKWSLQLGLKWKLNVPKTNTNQVSSFSLVYIDSRQHQKYNYNLTFRWKSFIQWCNYNVRWMYMREKL